MKSSRGRSIIHFFLSTFLLLSSSSTCITPTSSATVGWTVQDFPAPKDTSSVVDPDGVLSEVYVEKLNEQIHSLDLSVSVPGDESTVAVQVAVAVVEKMNLSGYQQEEEELAAEVFCRQLHDTWGVGHSTSQGGTGVVIFLSVYDRVIYISKGGALDKVLSNSRIESIISSSRPALKQAKYAVGLMDAVEAVAEYCQKGEPDWKEKVVNFFQGPYLFLMMWFGLLFNSLFGAYRRNRQARAYAQAQSQLSELDRQRAEALQGQYQATSCPICLENFQSSTVGSDNQPIKLLRCGHVFDESCWAEWVNSGQGTITKCPICQTDVGQPPAENPTPAPTPQQAAMMAHNNHDAEPNHDRAVQRFQQERNFRLMRLAMRYPNFINNRQVQRWTSPTYNGDLARDPGFVNNNPRVVSRASTGMGGSTGGGMSFGGGRSSGGRGGRF